MNDYLSVTVTTLLSYQTLQVRRHRNERLPERNAYSDPQASSADYGQLGHEAINEHRCPRILMNLNIEGWSPKMRRALRAAAYRLPSYSVRLTICSWACYILVSCRLETAALPP